MQLNTMKVLMKHRSLVQVQSMPTPFPRVISIRKNAIYAGDLVVEEFNIPWTFHLIKEAD